MAWKHLALTFNHDILQNKLYTILRHCWASQRCFNSFTVNERLIGKCLTLRYCKNSKIVALSVFFKRVIVCSIYAYKIQTWQEKWKKFESILFPWKLCYMFGWVGLGWILWDINNCWLFNAKSCLFIYIRYIWFVSISKKSKWFQVLLCIANISIKHQWFV